MPNDSVNMSLHDKYDYSIFIRSDNFIDYREIKPLIIKEFIVKAKKFSERHVPYFVD